MDVFLAGGKNGKQDHIYYVDHIHAVDFVKKDVFPALTLSSTGLTPKILSLFQSKRIECEYDFILDNLAKVILLQETDDWVRKFEGLDWDRVENQSRPDNLGIRSVFSDIFDIFLSESKATVLIKCFRSSTGCFDFQRFLSQLFKHVEIQRCMISSNVDGSERSQANIQRLKRIGRMVGLVKVRVAATMKEYALQHALAMVVQAVRIKVGYNEDVSTTSYRMGGLDVIGLRSEIKRVLNVSLTELQTEALFEVLDLDHNGLIDRHEFTTFFSGVAEDARLDKRLHEDKHRMRSAVSMKSINNCQIPRSTSTTRCTTASSATTTASDPDFETAMSKLRNYRNVGRNISLLPKDWMTADTLRSLLKTNCSINLTLHEVSAVASYLARTTTYASPARKDVPASPLPRGISSFMPSSPPRRRTNNAQSRGDSGFFPARPTTSTVDSVTNVSSKNSARPVTSQLSSLESVSSLKRWKGLKAPGRTRSICNAGDSPTNGDSLSLSNSGSSPTNNPASSSALENNLGLILISGQQFMDLYHDMPGILKT